MLDLLRAFARDYPIMAALLAILAVAALFVMADEYRRNVNAARRTDEGILAARRREAIRLANRHYENDEPRLHWWS